MWGQAASWGMFSLSLGSEDRMYVYSCVYFYSCFDDLMRQIQLGAEGSMGSYY